MTSNKNTHLSWAYENEAIEGLVKLTLSPESQEALGCQVMKDVFLEYPWAYVPREEVIRLLRQDDSQLLPFKDDIEKYEGDCFLVGYASKELVAGEFVICFTESARNEIATRNKTVKRLLDKRVHSMFYKTPKPWISKGSEFEVGENVTRRQRPLFEVEISVPTEILGLGRNLTDRRSSDAKDGCMEIVPSHEVFDLVLMSRLTTPAQTNLPGRETGVQTNFGFPKNAWTQYKYEYQVEESTEEIPAEDDEEEVAKDGEIEKDAGGSLPVEENPTEENPEDQGDEEPVQIQAPNPVELFLSKYTDEMIDVIDYNAAMNLHVHDIDELVLKGRDTNPIDEVLFVEVKSFIDLTLTAGKVISDVSWHPSMTGVAVVCYTDVPKCDLVSGINASRNALRSGGNGSVVLVWSLNDPMHPVLQLDHDRPIGTLSFCPFRPDVLVGGCETGHIAVWDFNGRLTKCIVENCCDEVDAELRTERLGVTVVSRDFQSQNGTVRQIQWLPPYHKVEVDGRLTSLTDNTSIQFLTACEDGCVAVWDLMWEPRAISSTTNEKAASRLSKSLHDEFDNDKSEFKKIDGLLKPIYNIHMQVPKETRNLPLLSLFVQPPLTDYEEIRSLHRPCNPTLGFDDEEIKFQTQTYDLKFVRTGTECPKQFWAGSTEGDFISCAWEGHEFTEVSSSENSKYLGWSRVHDGPVTGISQSPHLPEVMLTVGGRVFAVWKQDFLQSPLLLRKSTQSYAACCWTSRPGVFMVSKSNGDLETWDLCTSTNECLAVQNISGKRITGLFPHVLPMEPNMIGICDHNGAFRVFREPDFFPKDKSSRVEWLVDFVNREVKRKQEFVGWESNYLKTDPHCLQRKAARAADEAKRRHEEARAKFQKEQEELARLEEERRAKLVKKSKSEKWKEADLIRMKDILLAKKGFDPKELETTRKPLIRQDEERHKKLNEAREQVKDSQRYFKDAISFDLPKLPIEKSSPGVTPANTVYERSIDQNIVQGKIQYERIRDRAMKTIGGNLERRIFDPEKMITDARRKRRELDVEYQKRSRREERMKKLKEKK